MGIEYVTTREPISTFTDPFTNKENPIKTETTDRVFRLLTESTEMGLIEWTHIGNGEFCGWAGPRKIMVNVTTAGDTEAKIIDPKSPTVLIQGPGELWAKIFYLWELETFGDMIEELKNMMKEGARPAKLENGERRSYSLPVNQDETS